MGAIREIRLLVDLQGDIRKIAKVAFSRSDASVYLFPYAPNGRYFFGGRHMDEVEFEDQVRFSDDLHSDSVPKLSIHQSGRVHIQAKGVRGGPVSVSPLADWRGQHVATVGADNFQGLAPFTGVPSTEGAEIDHVIPTGELVENGRLVFYLAGDRPAFEEPNCRLVVTLQRPGLPRPIYIGIQAKGQPPLSEPDLAGVTAIAGWDVNPKEGEGVSYVYIRGI